MVFVPKEFELFLKKNLLNNLLKRMQQEMFFALACQIRNYFWKGKLLFHVFVMIMSGEEAQYIIVLAKMVFQLYFNQ